VRTQHVAINERITVVGAVRENLDHRDWVLGQSPKRSIVLHSMKNQRRCASGCQQNPHCPARVTLMSPPLVPEHHGSAAISTSISGHPADVGIGRMTDVAVGDP
jgi:hypothetical protein